ncbi:MAG TPA: FAD-dependent oxidoreductase [Candidatus Limnocylindrales bacterium]|nr:FAD-dependent oxidoreductase [Candidatus Limnocylindrales bacterium]
MGEIIIIGAGLAGLSTAFHLGQNYQIFEKESEVGGLCRSFEINGFSFDYTGHLLHMRDPYTKDLVARLLPDAFASHSRRAYIYSKGTYTEYPFQANTYGLSKEVIKECIAGFVEAYLKFPNGPQSAESLSFEDWVYQTFGAGIARHFMIPYNQKLWRTPLKEITADWVSWSVPRPTLDEILNGALGIKNRAFGYNPSFLYPKQGGICQLPQSFTKYIQNLHLKKKVVEISLQQRTICLDDNTVYSYDALVSTMPLPSLLRIIRDLPEEIRKAGKTLRYLSVYDVNLGVKRPGISDKHWIYFPEPQFPFYRVGFPMNYAPDTVPKGCSSMYVEVSHLPEEKIPASQLMEDVMAGLIQCGILRDEDEILASNIVDIPCAYVIHDRNRQEALKLIHPYLESQNIYAIGRYGRWEYSSMEQAILSGRDMALRLQRF